MQRKKQPFCIDNMMKIIHEITHHHVSTGWISSLTLPPNFLTLYLHTDIKKQEGTLSVTDALMGVHVC